MIFLIKGRQRQHKTTLAVGVALWLIENAWWRDRKGWHKYHVSDIHTNLKLYHPASEDVLIPYKMGITDLIPFGEELKDCHYYQKEGIQQFCRQMVRAEYRGKVVIIDEIDGVFSHRFWQNQEQTEAMIGFWQDDKLGNCIIATGHKGRAVDIILRECTQVELIPEYDTYKDVVEVDILNALDCEVSQLELKGISFIKQLFDTYEPIT